MRPVRTVVAKFCSPEGLRAEVLHALADLRKQFESVNEPEAPSATSPEAELPPPSIDDNPYRSLSAFQEEDAPFFFGPHDKYKGVLCHDFDKFVRRILAAKEEGGILFSVR